VDLVVVGEYMPIKIFRNENGRLKDMTQSTGLEKSHGWWNSLHVADINKDAYPDLIAANHGLNSRFKANRSKPVTMYTADFDNNGSIEHIINNYNHDRSYPMVLKHDLVSALPGLKKKYLKYDQYKNQEVEDIFSADELNKSVRLDAFILESCVLMNNKNGAFTIKPLPPAAQFSPAYGIAADDFDADGIVDILLGGNFYESKPEVGIYDGSYGLLLKGNGDGEFQAVPQQKSGLLIKGSVRDMAIIKSGKTKLVLMARNNDGILLFQYE
jgi:hypothetical protein